MKCDVVVVFYRQYPTWPCLVWGLAQNKDRINKVIVVNDELWHDVERAAVSLPLNEAGLDYELLEHPKEGVQPQRSIRQGVEAATTEYVVHIDGDIVLAPGAIAKMLDDAEASTLLYGVSHDIDDSPRVSYFPHPVILREDPRLNGIDNAIRWQLCRDTFVCVHRQTYLDMGGHHIAMPGYGCVDFELGMRWMMKYGMESVQLGRGVCWHISGRHHTHEAHPENLRIFNERRKEYDTWLTMTPAS